MSQPISVQDTNQHPSLERRGWGWLIMRQRKSTPPSLPFLRGGISLPKNSVIRAKNTRLSKLISKRISPRTTDAFGLPLSGNNPSAQRMQGTCKKALNFVQICRQIACQNLQELEECSIFVVLFESGRGQSEEFQARALPERKQGAKTRGTAPLLRKQERRSPRDVVIWAEKLTSR